MDNGKRRQPGMRDALAKEDYEEPQCLLNLKPGAKPIPIGRIVERLDAYLAEKDTAGAERHLRYWLAEAEEIGDARGKLALFNEQAGLYRKLLKKEECLKAADAAVAFSGMLGLSDTVTQATTYINAATGYKAFGRTADALPLYEAARKIYEARLSVSDERLGGLYNNMALALTETGRFADAEEMFGRALGIMSKIPHKEAEMAVTYLNLADLAAARHGEEKAEKTIEKYLDEAERLLDTADLPQNSTTAFFLEKCAPVFGGYGYFLAEKKFSERAKRFYERT